MNDRFHNRRPHPKLMRYYSYRALRWGPLFPVALILYRTRFRTLRYHIDDEGIDMRRGNWFRREVPVTFDRIQDIQLRRSLLERFMGLARLEIQTASGEAKAEVVLEGFTDYEELRAFLQERIHSTARRTNLQDDQEQEPTQDLAELLRLIAAELRAVRRLLTSQPSQPYDP